MLTYDQEVLTSLISQQKSAVNLLKELKTKSLKTLADDPHLLSSAKYNFIVAIEASIDICNHLISKNSYRAPEGYSDSFRVLAEQGVLSDQLVEGKLIAMARFRNRLVHQYWQIDTAYFHEILQNHLDDFAIFLDEINRSL